jgi:glycosyltransferase involved in cell wall biosynthesis
MRQATVDNQTDEARGPAARPPSILLIAYLFPPAGGVGVQRALSFAKYLPQFGHEVHVLSARNPSCPTMDRALTRFVPPEVSVHRSFTPELPFRLRTKLWGLVASRQDRSVSASGAPQAKSGGIKAIISNQARKVFSPDPEIVWTPFAVSAARRIIRRHGINVVLITVPPFSSLLIGAALKRELPHVKVISDFRDEWLDFTLSAFDFHNNDHALRRAREIESAAIASSDLVLSVVPSVGEQMRSRYPEQPASKFRVLTNGFDPDQLAEFHPRAHEPGKVVVAFLGTVYRPATLQHYLTALDSLPDEARSRFETRVIGRITEQEQEVVAHARSRVHAMGFMPQTDALRQMEEADYLLLANTDQSCAPAKYFEYLAMGKPILALTPAGGEIQRMLAEAGGGFWADNRDTDGIRGMLMRAHDLTLAGRTPQTSPARAERFSRVRLAGDLSAITLELMQR